MLVVIHRLKHQQLWSQVSSNLTFELVKLLLSRFVLPTPGKPALCRLDRVVQLTVAFVQLIIELVLREPHLGSERPLLGLEVLVRFGQVLLIQFLVLLVVQFESQHPCFTLPVTLDLPLLLLALESHYLLLKELVSQALKLPLLLLGILNSFWSFGLLVLVGFSL